MKFNQFIMALVCLVLLALLLCIVYARATWEQPAPAPTVSAEEPVELEQPGAAEQFPMVYGQRTRKHIQGGLLNESRRQGKPRSQNFKSI